MSSLSLSEFGKVSGGRRRRRRPPRPRRPRAPLPRQFAESVGRNRAAPPALPCTQRGPGRQSPPSMSASRPQTSASGTTRRRAAATPAVDGTLENEQQPRLSDGNARRSAAACACCARWRAARRPRPRASTRTRFTAVSSAVRRSRSAAGRARAAAARHAAVRSPPSGRRRTSGAAAAAARVRSAEHRSTAATVVHRSRAEPRSRSLVAAVGPPVGAAIGSTRPRTHRRIARPRRAGGGAPSAAASSTRAAERARVASARVRPRRIAPPRRQRDGGPRGRPPASRRKRLADVGAARPSAGSGSAFFRSFLWMQKMLSAAGHAAGGSRCWREGRSSATQRRARCAAQRHPADRAARRRAVGATAGPAAPADAATAACEFRARAAQPKRAARSKSRLDACARPMSRDTILSQSTSLSAERDRRLPIEAPAGVACIGVGALHAEQHDARLRRRDLDADARRRLNPPRRPGRRRRGRRTPRSTRPKFAWPDDRGDAAEALAARRKLPRSVLRRGAVNEGRPGR